VEQAFRWTKPAASSEIGVGDFEDLAASLFAFSATFEICRNDRSCVPTVIAVWGMSTGAAGTIGTVTVVTSSFGGWFAGALADRFGRVRMPADRDPVVFRSSLFCTAFRAELRDHIHTVVRTPKRQRLRQGPAAPTLCRARPLASRDGASPGQELSRSHGRA
jgi:hypothetical protein